jgi:hypothetical protein
VGCFESARWIGHTLITCNPTCLPLLKIYDLGAGRCSARISIYRSFDELTSLNAEREQLQADLEQWYDEDESLEREDELLGQLEALLQRYIRHERVVVVYGCSD